MTKKIITLLYLISIVSLIGCSSVPQKLDPKKFYKRDMDLKINGHQGEGVLVVPREKTYHFDIRAKGKLDLFTFSTCHREQTREKAGQRGWFADKKRRKFEYAPAPIEREHLACPAELGGYERGKGRHSWGFVDFEHPELNLPALVSCDGSVYNSRGVTVCQAKVGLIQEIKFAQPVLAPEQNVCTVLKSLDGGKTFRFKMPKGRCVFRFLTKEGEESWHRMTTLGYQSILIRED